VKLSIKRSGENKKKLLPKLNKHAVNKHRQVKLFKKEDGFLVQGKVSSNKLKMKKYGSS
jgi:hypothetical protein